MESRVRTYRKGEHVFLTTGEASKILDVSSRTVTKLFDTGRLTGWRISGTNGKGDRRISRESMAAYMKLCGLPVGDLAVQTILCGTTPTLNLALSDSGVEFVACPSIPDACLALDRSAGQHRIVFDANAFGCGAVREAAACLRRELPQAVLVALLPDSEDVGGACWREAGFSSVMRAEGCLQTLCGLLEGQS